MTDQRFLGIGNPIKNTHFAILLFQIFFYRFANHFIIFCIINFNHDVLLLIAWQIFSVRLMVLLHS